MNLEKDERVNSLTAKDWFMRALAAKIASEAYSNVGLQWLAMHYRERAVYFIAEGIRALALA